MKKGVLKTKKVIIPFCEGEAEIKLFSFIKSHFCRNNSSFRKPIDMEGFSDYKNFLNRYNNIIKSLDLKPKKDFINVDFLFIIDNDLDDSEIILNFLKSKGHLVQVCDPNTEGLLLKLIKKPQKILTDRIAFRKKTAKEFLFHFGCDAHKIREATLLKILNEESLKKSLPILYSLLN